MAKSARIDAQLIYSASESDANMLWATRFFAPDPFIFIRKRGRSYLVMNDLEIINEYLAASQYRTLSLDEHSNYLCVPVECSMTEPVVSAKLDASLVSSST